MPDFSNWSCPLPLADYPTIVMGHGGGGKLGNELVEHLFLPAFRNPALENLGDAAVLDTGGRAAGDEHRFICCAAAVFSRRINWRAGGERHRQRSGRLRRRAEISERQLHPGRRISAGATGGDCRCHGQGRGHGRRQDRYRRYQSCRARPRRRLLHHHGGRRACCARGSRWVRIVRMPGDAVIVSGTIGDHGMAIMSVREGLEFESPIRSDCAALNGMIAEVLTRQARRCTPCAIPRAADWPPH